MVFCNLELLICLILRETCHNPYFSRWFSAMLKMAISKFAMLVTILILVDGFLQSEDNYRKEILYNVTILILVDGFLQ